MGIRGLPFMKGKKGFQFAGSGFDSDGGGGGGGGTYTLPVASANVLGGVKIGSGLNITNDGILSASGGGGGSFDYSTTEFDTGQKWIDGKKIYGIVQNATRSDSSSTVCRFECGVVDNFIGGFGLIKGLEFTDTAIRMMFDRRGGSWEYCYAYFSNDPSGATLSFICTFYTKL